MGTRGPPHPCQETPRDQKNILDGKNAYRLHCVVGSLLTIALLPLPRLACPRVTLLLMALQAVGAAWMVEQPISSLAWYHPRLRSILRSFPKAHACTVPQTIMHWKNKGPVLCAQGGGFRLRYLGGRNLWSHSHRPALPGLCLQVVDGPLFVMHSEAPRVLVEQFEDWGFGSRAHEEGPAEGDWENWCEECHSQGQQKGS